MLAINSLPRPRIISMVMWSELRTIVGRFTSWSRLSCLIGGWWFAETGLSYLSSEDKLTIASYNIENFSANAKKVKHLRKKWLESSIRFINEIHSPDTITLIEVPDENGSVNDGTTSGVKSGEKLAPASKNWAEKLTRIPELPHFDGQDGGKPGSNIRVAFLRSKSGEVSWKRSWYLVTEAASFSGGHLVKNPARIAPTNPCLYKVRKILGSWVWILRDSISLLSPIIWSPRLGMMLFMAPLNQQFSIRRLLG